MPTLATIRRIVSHGTWRVGFSSLRGITGADSTRVVRLGPSANFCKHPTAADRVAVMAQSDVLKRYLDAGVAFTQMTRQRAEAIVRDLVKAGEVQSDQAQQVVQDLVER